MAKVFLLTVCSLMLLAQLITPAQSWSCCLRYTRRPLPCKRLLAYSFQNINQNCDINAVIFQTNGRFLCADPQSPHTQRGIRCIDQRRQRDREVMRG